MPQPAPVARRERIETLDVLRGFALLGILAMNIRAMAQPGGAYMYPYAVDFTGASRAAYIFTSVFFDLKMMGLFSMLFGVGVLLYAEKPTESGRPPTGLWFRRMFWLLIIGLVHAYLIWGGDILVPYALCGILLLWWVRRLSAGALAAGAVVFLLIGMGLGYGHSIAWQNMSEAERAEQAALMMPTPEVMQEDVATMLGGYTEMVAANAPLTLMFQTMFFGLFFFWRCGGMMMLGMALFKSGFLDGGRPAATYATTAAVCLPVGLGLAWYGVGELERLQYAMPGRAVADLWNYAGAVLSSVGYAAALIWVVKKGALGFLRRLLAPVGQMALTNYLAQSIITSAVFLGWGLGFGGRLDYAEQLPVVVAIWALQLVVSPMWLARYRFGPAEWLWRSLTYWERQPMARERTPSPALGGAIPGG